MRGPAHHRVVMLALLVAALAGCSRGGKAIADNTATTTSGVPTTTTTIASPVADSSQTSSTSTTSNTTTTTASPTTWPPSSISTTPTITISPNEPAGNRAPTVQITAPTHLSSHRAEFQESIVRFGTDITFTAIVSDPDGDPITVEWFSSLQGLLGTGTTLTAMIHTGDMDSSQPFITARVTDQWGRTGEDQIQIIVWVPSDA